MSLRNPNISISKFPPSEPEEAALDQDPLIAACLLDPDDPGHLEFEDVREIVSAAEEAAAAAMLSD